MSAPTAKVWSSKSRVAGSLVALYVAYRLVKSWRALRRVKHRDGVVPQSIQGQIGQSDSPLQHFFVNAQGLYIYTHSWEVANPKAIIFIVHGLGEHCLRYHHFATKLNEKGYSVFTMDNQGHGQSGGDRIHVEDFANFADDYWQYAKRIVARLAPKGQSDLPRFIMGHSLGGLITARLLTEKEGAQEFFKGAILSAPAIKPDPATASPQLIQISKYLAAIMPRLEVSALNAAFISRDQSVVWMYKKDILNASQPVQAHLGYQIFKSMALVTKPDTMAKFTIPVHFVHGTNDRLTVMSGSQEFHDGIASKDKSIKIYEDYMHEMINEPRRERDIVIGDLIGWLDARV
jgi:alpha-beta hydrolase superfamily lysophospholipase